MIARILNEKNSDISTLIQKLKDNFPEAIKPYEIDLDKTVERALSQHTEVFKYRKGFNYWELKNYSRIERMNKIKEGKKKFNNFKKKAEDDSTIKPPSQNSLLYAMLAFVDEGDTETARELAENYIDVNALGEDEKTRYWQYRWRLSS